MREFIVITNHGDVIITDLKSDSHLPPDERADHDIVDEAKRGDGDFPHFIDKFKASMDVTYLDNTDVKALLTIYRNNS